MGCLIFSILIGILGIALFAIGVQDGDILSTIMGIFFTLPGIVSVLAMVFSNTEKAKKDKEDARNRLVEKIKSNFTEAEVEVSQQYITPNYSVLVLDEKNKKVSFLDSGESLNLRDMNFFGAVTDSIEYLSRTYYFKDILEVEVIVDGEMITKTSRSSQVGRAVLGALLAGGVGAIIGGVTGKTSSIKKVKSIQLKIIVNDIKNPILMVDFLNENTVIDRTSEKFTKANEEVMHWHSLFKVIIDAVDKEE